MRLARTAGKAGKPGAGARAGQFFLGLVQSRFERGNLPVERATRIALAANRRKKLLFLSLATGELGIAGGATRCGEEQGNHARRKEQMSEGLSLPHDLIRLHSNQGMAGWKPVPLVTPCQTC